MNTLYNFLLILLITSYAIISCQHRTEDGHPEVGHLESVTENHQEHNGHQHDSRRKSGGNQVLSPDRMAMADVGNTHVHIEYSAPSVRDRVIWGSLVSYDRVWVTGAHMATSIEFINDMVFEGVAVPAGKYAIFTIPGSDSWTFILNENWNQHLADDYDQEFDVLRLEVIPEPNEFTEQLTYLVSGNAEGEGHLEFYWEKLKFRIHIAEK